MNTPPHSTAQLESLLRGRFHADAQARVMRAAELASAVHATQKRPDGAPYLSHVLEVAALVLSWCPHADADVVCTALLHDSVEDQAHQLAARGSSTASTEITQLQPCLPRASASENRKRCTRVTR